MSKHRYRFSVIAWKRARSINLKKESHRVLEVKLYFGWTIPLTSSSEPGLICKMFFHLWLLAVGLMFLSNSSQIQNRVRDFPEGQKPTHTHNWCIISHWRNVRKTRDTWIFWVICTFCQFPLKKVYSIEIETNANCNTNI